ncbi:MAG: acetate--CoA ligase family protein [Cellvibrionales bacterium]|nr:acetate--CoA ligase family protein [Cellvibrionales bacterium]
MPSSSALQTLFRPHSVAVVGASNDTNKFGGKVARNIARSTIAQRFYINAKGGKVQGQPAYKSLADLPAAPDAVVLAVPAPVALQELRRAAEMGTRAAVVFAAGFREAGEQGRAREAELAKLAADYDLALVGPNCVGIANFADQVFLSSADGIEPNPPGNIALISQSGSLGIVVSSRQQGRFRYQITTGNETVLKTHHLMQALLDQDPKIQTFALLLEAVHDPAGLAQVVAAAHQKGKRTVLLKLAGSATAGKIAALHTGAVSGAMAPLQAYCRDHRILLAASLREFYAVLTLLSTTTYQGGTRVGIYTASGGTAVLGADFAESQGLDLPTPPPAARQAVAATLGSQAERITNPLDTTGIHAYDATRFAQALSQFADPNTYDLVLVPLGGAGGQTALDRIQAIAQVMADSPVPIVPVWQQLRMLEEPAFKWLYESGRAMFTDYESPLEAMALISALDDSPPATTQKSAESATTKETPNDAHAATGIPFKDALLALEAAGAPIAPIGVVTAKDDPAQVFARYGQPLALKANHPQLLHKSDAKLVVFPVATPDQFRAETARMTAACQDLGLPDAELIAQSAVTGGLELLCGFQRDPELGPYIVLGAGGIYTEILKDSAVALIADSGPASSDLKSRLEKALQRLRCWPILKGTRGDPGYDWPAAIAAILPAAEYFRTNPKINGMELNPLTLMPAQNGAQIVDARIL